MMSTQWNIGDRFDVPWRGRFKVIAKTPSGSVFANSMSDPRRKPEHFSADQMDVAVRVDLVAEQAWMNRFAQHLSGGGEFKMRALNGWTFNCALDLIGNKRAFEASRSRLITVFSKSTSDALRAIYNG